MSQLFFFQEASKFMCQSGGKFERFTFQKLTLCSNRKTCDFFGEVLVVMCTIN